MRKSLFDLFIPMYYDSFRRRPICYDFDRRPVDDECRSIRPKYYCEKKIHYDPINVLVKLDSPLCFNKPKDDKPEDCSCDKPRQCCCCKPKPCCCCKPKPCCCDPCRSVLSSATGGAGPLPILAAGDLTVPIPVVSVTISTCCLCDPSVLLNFTTQISLPAASTTALVFQVLRSGPCSGTSVPVGSTFTYTNTVVAATSDSFSFQVFDSNLSRGTYTYSVVLTTGTTATVAGVTLINSTLSARAASD